MTLTYTIREQKAFNFYLKDPVNKPSHGKSRNTNLPVFCPILKLLIYRKIVKRVILTTQLLFHEREARVEAMKTLKLH